MRLGCCGGIGDAGKIRDAGFEFLEVGVQGVLKGLEDDAAWSASAPDFDALPLPIEAANVLVPGSLPLIGGGRDVAALRQYMERVARRAKTVGIERIVFGSGGARKRPDDVDEATAMAELAEFCGIAGDALAKHDVVLVIEHLNRKETNTINTLAQERELMDRVNHPAVAALVDTYHFGLENDSEADLLSLGHRLKHVHVAEVVDRIQPGGHEDASKRYDFEHFFCVLRKMGYRERVSFEGKWTGPVEEVGAACVKFLREAWASADHCEV